MNKPAYLVEGDLEQKFLQKICPGSPVRKINCNGKDVSLEAIAERVESLGRLIHKRFSPIVVVFDREGRTQTCEQIEAKLFKLLEKEMIQVRLVIAVADRQVENWILADYEMFTKSAAIQNETARPSFEGENGKSRIREALGRARIYVETIDGVAWLQAARPEKMVQNSPSFSRLVTALAELPCWWLEQRRMGV
jgi:hypothetical protein